MAVADIDKQLCFALYSASNRVTSLYRQLLDPLGLTYTQFVVMMVLWKEDKLSITELASKAELSKATMTPLLKRLEQKGLIQRAALPDNDRQKSVVLTQEGIELSRNSADITDKIFCMTGLSAEEANTMISLCKKLGR